MLETIEEYRIITSIYKTLSLTRSSEEFGVLPGAMSKKLSAIESKLGRRLFNRSTRELSPTEDGELFYRHAIEVIEKIESFENKKLSSVEPEGLIKVSASTSFARLYLMPVLSKFLERYPKVKIDLVLSDQFSDIIKEGIDLAIRIAPLTDSTLISKRLGNGRKAVCASKAYLKRHGVPKKPQDLKDHNCIILGSDNNWSFRRGNKTTVVKVRGNLKTNYGEMLARSVESGLGISILSLWHAHEEIKSGKIVTLLDDYELTNQAEIFLVYPDKTHLPQKVRAFLDFVTKELELPFR